MTWFKLSGAVTAMIAAALIAAPTTVVTAAPARISYLIDDPAPPDEALCPAWGWGPYFVKQKNIQSHCHRCLADPSDLCLNAPT